MRVSLLQLNGMKCNYFYWIDPELKGPYAHYKTILNEMKNGCEWRCILLFYKDGVKDEGYAYYHDGGATIVCYICVETNKTRGKSLHEDQTSNTFWVCLWMCVHDDG